MWSVQATSLVGRILVATPLIGDGVFERSVVLLLAHGEEGAFGIVLNRPSDTLAGDLLPDWGAHVAAPAVMFIGGPVASDAVIGLAATGTVDLTRPPLEGDGVDRVRLFAGSAGWAPGQLEGEIGEHAWWVLDSEPADRFTSDPSGLWRQVLRRQDGPTGWFAQYPVDPMVN